jgi:hypothetical protein
LRASQNISPAPSAGKKILPSALTASQCWSGRTATRLRRRRDPARRARRKSADSTRSWGYRPAAAVRSMPSHRAAGSGATRFIAASSGCVIHVRGTSKGGAGHDGCRGCYCLLAGGSGRIRAKRHFPACEAGRRGPVSARPSIGPHSHKKTDRTRSGPGTRGGAASNTWSTV